MIGLLAKLFIKNNKDYSDNAVREKYGFLTGFVGIFLNLLISAGKIVVGVLSSSVAVLADGINNLTDAGSSVVTIFSFKIANKPVDKEHPFGHGRMEYVAAMIVSVIIVVVGAEVFINSLQKIITPQEVSFSVVTIIILALSVSVKLYMFAYNFYWSKKINSAVMKATAYDSISDAVSTAVVLICSCISFCCPSVSLDGYAGIVVALFIVTTGFRSFAEIISDLLGKPPKKEFAEDVKKYVLQNEIIRDIHDLVVHDYGPGRTMLSLHVEVPADMSVGEAHEQIDKIELGLSEKFNCHALIHMDPACQSGAENERLYKKITAEMSALYSGLSVHDFRVNNTERGKEIFFDAVVPYEVDKKEDQIKKELTELVEKIDPTSRVFIKIDRPLYDVNK